MWLRDSKSNSKVTQISSLPRVSLRKKFQVPVDLESGLRKQRGQESVKSSLEKESISSVNLGQDVESADKLVNCHGIRAFKVFADKEEDIGKNEAQPASSTRKLH